MIGPFLPTKKIAKAKQAKHYYTGIKCKHGHLSPRYAINGACVECVSSFRLTRKAADPEKWKEQKRMERQRAKEKFPDRAKKHTREWMARWRAENPNEAIERSRRWRLENYERSKVFDRRNRAKRAKADGRHKASDILDILSMQKYKCAYCRVSVRNRKNRHVDHIKPISKGGSNDRNNLQILCQPCNSRKAASDPIDYARKRGLLA